MNTSFDKNDENSASISSLTSTHAPGSINSRPARADLSAGRAWVSGPALCEPWRLDRTLKDLLLRAVKQSPEHGIKTYELSGGENWISYPDFYAAAEIAARNFLAKGLKPGDKVILQTRGTSSTLLMSWACFLSGVVAVPMPPLVTLNRDAAAVARLRSVWEFLSHPAIIAEESFSKSLSAFTIKESWGELRLLHVEDLLKATKSTSDIALPVIHPDDLALMPLTSGSTGMPKAVQLSHRNILAMSAGTCQQNSFHAGDVSLNWMPLDHPGALIFLCVVPMDAGASQIHAPTASILEDILLWLELIDQSKATISWAPNFAFALLSNALVRTERRFDLSSMRFLISAGEHVAPET
ncbi:MAG: AMP-binding protein, partial [Methylocystis sp.]